MGEIGHGSVACWDWVMIIGGGGVWPNMANPLTCLGESI